MILGLPALSFWMLLGAPAIVMLVMFVHCWQLWRKAPVDESKSVANQEAGERPEERDR